jgi:ribonuclease R
MSREELRFEEEFEGKVNSIIERGIFVQLTEYYCKRFVPFETMSERFELGEDSLVVTGRRSGMKLQMGNKLRVQIVSADIDSCRIKKVLVEDGADERSNSRNVNFDTRTNKENKAPRRAKKKGLYLG